ncbi:hypothetical protein D3C73_1345960 [compost metagenome]
MLPFLQGNIRQLVEAAGYFLLMLQAFLVTVQHGLIIVVQLFHAGNNGAFAYGIDVAVNLHGVETLFLTLNDEEVGEAVQVLGGTVGRHRQVNMGRVEFKVHLFIQCFQQVIA